MKQHGEKYWKTIWKSGSSKIFSDKTKTTYNIQEAEIRISSNFPTLLSKTKFRKDIATEKVTFLEIRNTHEKLIFCSYETK